MRFVSTSSVVLSCVALVSGCGLIDDLVENASATPVELPAIEEGSLADPVQTDVLAPVALSPEAPTFSLPPGIDTSNWGPIIKAHLLMEEQGEVGPFAIELTDFVYTGEPVRLDVAVSTREGSVRGDSTLNAAPVAPASCGFGVNSETTAEELSGALTTCVLDWVSDNGVPDKFELTATASDPSAARDLGEFTLGGFVALKTKQAVVAKCGQGLGKGIKKNVLENIDNVQFKDVSVAGEAWSSANVFVTGFGTVYDADGQAQAHLGLAQAIGANQSVWIEAQVDDPKAPQEFTAAGTARFGFAPAFPGWLGKAIDAIAGKNTGGRPGSGRVCYVVSGDAPRTGSIYAVINATASFTTGD